MGHGFFPSWCLWRHSEWFKVGEMNPTPEVVYLHHMLEIPWRKLTNSHVVSQLQQRNLLPATICIVSIALIWHHLIKRQGKQVLGRVSYVLSVFEGVKWGRSPLRQWTLLLCYRLSKFKLAEKQLQIIMKTLLVFSHIFFKSLDMMYGI